MRRAPLFILLCAAAALLVAPPAAADHTDPEQAQSSTREAPAQGNATGDGEWAHITNIPANPGTDVELFTKGGAVYSASGTLGQGSEQHVGQRIMRLVDAQGVVDPTFIADHGSAACQTNNTGVTSLQHDSQVTPRRDPQLLFDNTDTTGRCHDPVGGGVEIVDISGLGTPGFVPRELHLTRHDGSSHTMTAVDAFPHLLVNNTSEFANMPWMDILDVSSCMNLGSASLASRRAFCRPQVYRIPFQDAWSSQRRPDNTLANPAACHDTTSVGTRLYCAGLNATLIFDIADMVDADGKVKGTPLPCVSADGTNTGAKVTDCRLANATQTAREAWVAKGSPQAQGWRFLGSFNHPGRNDQAGNPNTNTNTIVPSSEGVAVAHEADPSPDGKWLFVTDERGGGIVPGGATCTPGLDNPYGNGGIHVFDVSDPSQPKYALKADGTKAVFIGEPTQPSPTFCTVHIIEHIPDEQRLFVAWYSQGTKVVDYEIDANGRWTFTEVASFTLPGAQEWVSEPFKIVNNTDGSRTYYLFANDIGRGIDIMSWTGPKGKPAPQAQPVPSPSPSPSASASPSPSPSVSPSPSPSASPSPSTSASPSASPSPSPSPSPSESDGPSGSPTVPAGGGVEVRRISGLGRVETAAKVSQDVFASAPTVVLARSDDYADALSGAPLAAAEGAPMLLTGRESLDPLASQEIRRLGASRAVLLGGEAALSPQVEADVAALGLTVERVSGLTRFSTAAAVGRKLGASHPRAFVVEGANPDPTRGWPDAVSVAPYAAHLGAPVLLVTRDDLPDDTATALRELGVTEAVVVGGRASVSDEVLAELAAAGHGPRRISGPDRYRTSEAVLLEAESTGMDPARLFLATGRAFADALSGGPAVAAVSGSLLLVDGQSLDGSPGVRDLLQARAGSFEIVRLLGGPAAISEPVEAEVRALVGEGSDSGSAESDATPTSSNRPSGGLSRADVGFLAAFTLLVPAAAARRRRAAARAV